MSIIGTTQPGMHPDRMGAIALGLLWAKWDKEGGIKIGSELQRTLGQIAKDTGFSREELETFSKEILVRYENASDHIRKLAIVGLVMKRNDGPNVRHKLTLCAESILVFCKKLQ